MGCKNTKSVSKPVELLAPKSFILTPAVMRRNLKTEILKNKGKIRKLEDEIIRYQADHFEIRSSEPKSLKLAEIDEKIQNMRSKIFNYQTHNMILELHLETAAPGQYPHAKPKRLTLKPRRSSFITQSNTMSTCKQTYGYLQTEASTYGYGLMTKPSNVTEQDWVFRSSIQSVSEESSIRF